MADLIQEMKNILDQKDAFKRYKQFYKKYRTEDYASKLDYPAKNIEDLKEDFEYYSEKISSEIKSKSNNIKLYRSIRIPDYGEQEILDFVRNLIQSGKFTKNGNTTKQAGIYWSYSPKGSRVYWSDSGSVIKFIGTAPLSSIDIESTLWISLINPSEKEIRLKPKAPIKITNLRTYSKSDKLEVQKLLKNMKDIQVQAVVDNHRLIVSMKKPKDQTTTFKDFTVEFKDEGIKEFTVYDKDGEYAGYLQVVDDASGYEGKPYVMGVEIETKHRRKGIATFLYDWAEKLFGEKLVRSVDQTEDAVKFWESRSTLIAALKEILVKMY